MQLQTDGHEVIVTSTKQDKVSALNAKGLKAFQYELGEQLSHPDQLFDSDVLITAITSKDTGAFDVLMDQLTEQACKHLLFISSTSVYQNDGLLHDETSQRLNTKSPLLAIEQLIQLHPSASIIRFAGLVGPKRHPGRFFTGDKVLKNPDAPINLIHLDDCIGIIKTVIEQNAWNEIFNGCADCHPTKLQFYGKMAQQLGIDHIATANDDGRSHKIIDNHKIKTTTAYHFLHPDLLVVDF